MISNPRDWQICLQQRVTLEKHGTNRHPGGGGFPNMGWLLLWETWKRRVNKEIRFASQRVWETWRCLDRKRAVVQELWPELCPAPGVREEQLGGQHQAGSCRDPVPAPCPFWRRGNLSHPCDAPALSPPSLAHHGSPSHSRCSTEFLEEILNTPGSVKILQRHRKKSLKFSQLASSVRILPKRTGGKLNKEAPAFSLYWVC